MLKDNCLALLSKKKINSFHQKLTSQGTTKSPRFDSQKRSTCEQLRKEERSQRNNKHILFLC